MQKASIVAVALILPFGVGSPVDSADCTDAVADLRPQAAHALLQVHNELRSLDAPAGGIKRLLEVVEDVNKRRSPTRLKASGEEAWPSWLGGNNTEEPTKESRSGGNDAEEPKKESRSSGNDTEEPKKESVAGPTCCMFEMGHVFTDKRKESSAILPVDCSRRTLPIHVDSYAAGYVFRELGIATGGYRELFVVPFKRTSPPFEELHACGINPKDSVIYCVMSIGGAWYITRMDRDSVEFAAKLNSTAALSGIISSATFGPSGNFYFMTNRKPFTIYTVSETETLPGFDSQSASGLTDLSALSGSVVEGCETCEDMVAVDADLDGSGSKAEYLLTFTGDNLQVVKAEGTKAEYKSWTIPASGKAGDAWTAGWSYSGEVFFTHSKGEGVYQIPVSAIDLNAKATIQVKKVAEAEPSDQIAGTTCMNSRSPFNRRCNISFYHEVEPFTNGTCPHGSLLVT